MKTPVGRYNSRGNALIMAVITTSVILAVGASVFIGRSQRQAGTAKVAQRTMMEVSADVEARGLHRKIKGLVADWGSVNSAQIASDPPSVPTVTQTISGEGEQQVYGRSRYETLTGNGTAIIIPAFWAAIPSEELAANWTEWTAAAGRDDPFEGINNRKGNLAFISAVESQGNSTLSQMAGSSLTQIIQSTVRTFPASAFMLLDKRGASTCISPTSGFHLGVGRVYTLGKYRPTTTASVFEKTLVAIGGIATPNANAVLNFAGSAMPKATGHHESGENDDDVKPVIWTKPNGTTWNQHFNGQKQNSMRGAIATRDDMVSELQTPLPKLSDNGVNSLIGRIANQALADVEITIGVISEPPNTYGVTTVVNSDPGNLNLLDVKPSLVYIPAVIVDDGSGPTVTQQQAVIFDIGDFATRMSAIQKTTRSAFFILPDGVNVFFKNSNTGSTITSNGTEVPLGNSVFDGFTLVSDSRVNVFGNYGAGGAGKNLIIAPEISVLTGEHSGLATINSSIVTRADIPGVDETVQVLTKSPDLGPITNHCTQVTLNGSLALWEERLPFGLVGPSARTILGLTVVEDLSMRDGQLAPLLTPAVSDIRIGEVRRVSGTYSGN